MFVRSDVHTACVQESVGCSSPAKHRTDLQQLLHLYTQCNRQTDRLKLDAGCIVDALRSNVSGSGV